MSACGRSAILLPACLLATLLGGAAAAQNEGAPESLPLDAAAGGPRISIRRLGPVEVEGRRRVILAEATADLAGETWNTGPEDELAVLWQPVGPGPWSVAAVSPPEPGGLFEIAGIRFPDSGEYRLVVGLFARGDLAAGARLPAERWRERAHAISRELAVHVMAPPPELAQARPSLAILAVGDAAIDPHRTTPVPARGEIVLRAGKLPPGAQVYLAILAPYSDRCYLHGPARPGFQEDRYLLEGVSLEVPGDPRQGHLELIAVVAQEPLVEGPMSFKAFRRRDLQTSPTVDVLVDERFAATNSQRVPYLAITRIGRHTLKGGVPPDQPLPILPGDAIEVGEYDRVPEGARLSILTRPRGSRLWRVQGPALLQGTPSREPRQGPPEARWVWLSPRFEHPDPEAQDREKTREEFEVLAVLSTGSLPDAWVDSAALASGFVQTISPLVTVSVEPPETPPKPTLTITSVGGQEVDPETQTAVGAVERVEVAAREELPAALHVYVARAPFGSSSWTLTETLARGKSLVAPALSFVNPHAHEGARYQLLAVATRGWVTAEQLEYDDLVRAAVATSDVVTVRYENGGLAGLRSRLRRFWSETAEPTPDSLPNEPSSLPPKGGKDMLSNLPWTVILLTCFGLTLLVFLALLALERRVGLFAPLARGATERIERGLRSANDWFSPPPRINPASFLLGLVLLRLLFWVILHRYLPLYAAAVAVVTDLSPKESAGLALWLVLLTGLSGVFLELTSDPTLFGEGSDWVRALRIVLAVSLGLALLFLMVFQALFYFTFLRKTVGGLVPALGGIAFFLIAFVEAIAFFFITRLTVPPIGTLLVRLFRLPWALAGLIARFFARLFEGLKRKPKKEKDYNQEKPS